jgi:hypothetical protein
MAVCSIVLHCNAPTVRGCLQAELSHIPISFFEYFFPSCLHSVFFFEEDSPEILLYGLEATAVPKSTESIFSEAVEFYANHLFRFVLFCFLGDYSHSDNYKSSLLGSTVHPGDMTAWGAAT